VFYEVLSVSMTARTPHDSALIDEVAKVSAVLCGVRAVSLKHRTRLNSL